MLRQIAIRLPGLLLTLLVVSLLTFVALNAAPGDAAQALAGDTASAAQMTAIRQELGLTQPLMARYAGFLGDLVLKGNLGRSLVNGKPVAELILERLPYTLALALAAMAVAVAIGTAAGVAAAQWAGRPQDTLLMAAATLGLAVPSFWSALLLIMLFSLGLHWLPVTGAGSWQNLVMPVAALALPTTAVVARLTRASVLEVLSADYVRTAHGKGLTPRAVVSRHVLRNALSPVVTVLGLHMGHLLGGSFVVETIFAWPGLGRLAVQAIFDRDYPVVMGCTLVVAAIYLAINLAVDVAHLWLDPQAARAASQEVGA